MNTESTKSTQQDRVSRLVRLAEELTAGINENEARRQEHVRAAELAFAESEQHLDHQATQANSELEAEFTNKLESVRRQFEDHVTTLEQERGIRSGQVSKQRTQALLGAKDDCEQTEIHLKDQLTHDSAQLKRSHERCLERCQTDLEELALLEDRTWQQLSQRGVELPNTEVDTPTANSVGWSSTLLRSYEEAAQQVQQQLTTLARTKASRFLSEGWSLLVLITVGFVVAWPSGQLVNYHLVAWITSTVALAVTMAVTAYQLAHRRSARELREAAPTIASRIRDARTAIQQAQIASKNETKAGAEELRKRTQELTAEAHVVRQKRTDEAESAYREQTTAIEQAFLTHQTKLDQQWNEQADAIRDHYRPLIVARREFFEKQKTRSTADFEKRIQHLNTDHSRIQTEFCERWRETTHNFAKFVAEIHDQCGSLDTSQWKPPTDAPHAITVGHYKFNLPEESNLLRNVGMPSALPAILTFPQRASMILRADGTGRDEAIRVLQNTTLQMLATFPAGSLRLTVLDPVGLGQNFSAFMHLADFDERLITSRIWTETPHINQKLADLTEHMENVIQKYLRNEYASMQEYNRQAGEVAEPYRLLVVANFPHRFSDEAIRRLVSIANSGPKCGIYTLMSVDDSVKLPRGFDLNDLAKHAQRYDWCDDRFQDREEPFCAMPLQLDAPPSDEVATNLIQSIGRRAQETSRIELPFSAIVPAEQEMWTADCRDELLIPLGRASATKRQYLTLGRGTSQHVLISGKTGSGKSTLLNAIITSAAMHYPPEQLQFLLIDFKKGVEFKAYADIQLPHAQVIAIESEREFGLSVLQRLDDELRIRGDLFRDAGVQTLTAFRSKHPHQPLPRLLLIVDEFQEFFVNDDKIAHEASLLLDRLVRQGRAFGIHVILGSQTLAGAYSLARSTIGQMAVRIALECSAADAHLILSEDNTAARLLGRPGEAIYNDANGMIEGNHPFQVVWLPDEERNQYLTNVRNFADAKHASYPPAIVFEGHSAADLPENSLLKNLIDSSTNDNRQQAARAWLGSAISIKDPTSAVFRRQSGSNLVVVGQYEDLARGILGSSCISLVAGHSRLVDGRHVCDASFQILDGLRADDDETEFGDLLAKYLPADVQVSSATNTKSTIESLAQQVTERLKSADETTHQAVYIVIYDLARFRDLQASEDDFGLGSFGDSTSESTSSQFAKLLRDGPSVGIHALIWADCYHTLSRWIDRATMRDLAQRVLFQMSAVDSSHLMDSASASHLGTYRSILYDHDRGQTEKFRPYGMPPENWLAAFRERLTHPRNPTSTTGELAVGQEE